MPYKDADTQRAYQREWIARRRAEWFAANGPCVDCGTWDELELDHADATTKVTHRVWSWSAKRREAELAKCVVRCQPCHEKKAKTEKVLGEAHGNAVLSDRQIAEIRRLSAADGTSHRELAKLFGTSKATVGRITRSEVRTRGTWTPRS